MDWRKNNETAILHWNTCRLHRTIYCNSIRNQKHGEEIMTKIICDYCRYTRDQHTTYGWNNCQLEIAKRNSSKDMPGGVQ